MPVPLTLLGTVTSKMASLVSDDPLALPQDIRALYVAIPDKNRWVETRCTTSRVTIEHSSPLATLRQPLAEGTRAGQCYAKLVRYFAGSLDLGEALVDHGGIEMVAIA